MPTMIPGMTGTGDWATDQRPKNFREMILRLFPDSPAIMTAFLGKLSEEATTDPEFAWFEQGLPEMRATVEGAHNDSVTDIVLDGQYTYKAFRAGFAVMNERTTEVMWVSSSAAIDASTSKIVVVRAQGSSAAAMVDADGILILGSHSAEGASVPEAIAMNPSKVYNWTQIFRDSLYLTRTADATKLRTGPDYQKKKRDLSEQHALRMEQSFLWGTGVEGTGSNGKPDRTTKGFFRFMSSNICDFSSGVDTDLIDDYCEQIFRQGSSTRLVLAGSTLLNVFNKAIKAASHYNITSSDKVYGWQVTEWITPYGRLLFKLHPLLSQNPTFRSWGVVLDTKNIKYRYLTGRDTEYMRDRQNPGDDAIKDELLSECGLEVQHESTHAIFKSAATLAA
jgi:hypothetical protein